MRFLKQVAVGFSKDRTQAQLYRANKRGPILLAHLTVPQEKFGDDKSKQSGSTVSPRSATPIPDFGKKLAPLPKNVQDKAKNLKLDETQAVGLGATLQDYNWLNSSGLVSNPDSSRLPKPLGRSRVVLLKPLIEESFELSQ